MGQVRAALASAPPTAFGLMCDKAAIAQCDTILRGFLRLSKLG